MNQNLLRTLTISPYRVLAIFALRIASEPKSLADLSRELGTHSTTISHAIEEAVSDGTIEHVGRKYRLSNVGQVKAMLLSDMVTALDVLEQTKEFWQSHYLGGIPSNLLAKIGMLSGATCIRDAPDAPLDSQKAFIESVMRAKEMRGVSGIIAPGYQEMILSILEKGAKVSLILTRGVIAKIEPDALKAAMAYENFTLHEIPSGVKVAFTVTNELVSLALYHMDGSYDPQQDLICEGEKAVEWGMELFEYYLKQATKIV